MPKDINCRKRLGLKDRFIIVKLAVQHAVNPNTERYMFASKSIKDDEIKVSSYSNFKGEPSADKALNIVSEWMCKILCDNAKTLDEFNRPLRGYMISIWQAWERQNKTGLDVVLPAELFVDKTTLDPSQITDMKD